MISVQIIGIRKPGGAYNTHAAISHYQWRDGTGQVVIWDRVTMVNWLLADRTGRAAYVADSRGDVVYCKVMQNQFGTRYLETRPDATLMDNLLSLPQV